MQTDSNMLFVGGTTSGALAVTSSAVRSTGILDLATGLQNTGTTYSAAPLTIGNATVFGEDLGAGPWRFNGIASIGTTFVGGTSLNIAWQGAADNSGGTYPANFSGLSWFTYGETGVVLTGALAAGVPIKLPDWPFRQISAPMPRFISLLFTPAGTFTAGAVAFAGMFMPSYVNQVGLYPSGFSVGA